MIKKLPHNDRHDPEPCANLPALPPSSRSRVALGLTAAAALGRFELQVCGECGLVQYPPREACHRCLCTQLDWQPQSGDGELISETMLAHSNDPYFRERVPLRQGIVRLDCGPIVIVHVHSQVAAAPARVRVSAALDKGGQGALVAFPHGERANMTDDKKLHEMTCDPRARRVLVTDATTAAGGALVRALVGAGAAVVWAGRAPSVQPHLGSSQLEVSERVRWLPLDITRSDSVREAAASVGAQLDILISNAEVHGVFSLPASQGVAAATAEMEVNYLGLLRLAQEFGPMMRSRRTDGEPQAVAWVNLLSVYALANLPAHATFCASKAAAYSLSQYLRAQMQPAGIRVINVFPGPLDDEWNRDVPPPRLPPDALAKAIVGALRGAVEDIYPGDFAQEYLARWRANPKTLERELASGR
jgi:NAD(P)-dependent dehydrogenase (short-subunit alcohol dehydrogenase family)/uncharacterized OB-fold protein